jgi:hypothetical protein
VLERLESTAAYRQHRTPARLMFLGDQEEFIPLPD